MHARTHARMYAHMHTHNFNHQHGRNAGRPSNTFVQAHPSKSQHCQNAAHPSTFCLGQPGTTTYLRRAASQVPKQFGQSAICDSAVHHQKVSKARPSNHDLHAARSALPARSIGRLSTVLPQPKHGPQSTASKALPPNHNLPTDRSALPAHSIARLSILLPYPNHGVQPTASQALPPKPRPTCCQVSAASTQHCAAHHGAACASPIPCRQTMK